MAITTRETTATGVTNKGSPLTNAEVDTNFIELQQEKIELTDLSVGAEGEASGDGSISYDNSTGVFTYTPPADISGAVTFAAQAGEALTKGDVVYVSGVSGNKPVVSKADADDASKMPAYGLVEADASLNAAVNVITFGTLYDLDTSGFSAGDTVYVSTTAGAITSTSPTGESSLLQNIGKIIRSHASAGSIKVGGAGRTNATPNLNDGNVFIGNASNQAAARALTTADIQSGTFADARIAESNVTQHEAALSITEAQISNLQAYLTAETNDLSSAVTWANVPDANITQSSVTQHQAALSITESQISDLQTYLTAETNDLSASVTWANVPDANITQSSVTQHQAALSITASQISDLQTYLTAETDTLDSVTDRGASTTNAITTGAVTVNGRLYANEGQSASYIRIGNTANTGGYIGYGTPDSTSLSLWTNGNVQAITIDGAGKVGVGTTDPDRYFHVNKSVSGDWVTEIHNTHTTNGFGLKVRAGDDGDVHSFFVADVDNTGLFSVRGHGYVGIGNTNPQRRLSVHEPAASTGCWSQFTNAQTGTSSGAGTLVGIDSSQDFRILNYENTRLRFYTNGTDRMQVNANGTINASSSTGSSYLMTLTNGSSSAGEGQVLQLDASGRGAGTKDIDVFNIQNADGTIHGVRNDGQTYMQGTQSSPFVAKTSDYATKFGVLPWSGGRTYISSGVIYDNNGWVHASDTVNSCLLGIDGSSGGVWYASSNSSSSWNTASAEALWNASGHWAGGINTSSTANVGGVNVLGVSGTISTFAGTGSSTYVAFKSASTTTRGYVGNGSGLLTGASNADFIVRSQSTLKFAAGGNNLAATLSTAGNFTAVGDIQGANLQSNVGDYGSIAAVQTRGGYYGLSCNGNLVLMSNGTSHGIYDDVNNDWWVRFFENAGVRLHYNASTRLETTSAGVTVSGAITATGNITAYSDARLKSNIQTLDGSKVYQMRGVSFEKDGAAGSGVVAQELKEIAPELVSEGSEYLSVAYGNLVGYLIEAVKDLKAEVDELKKAAA